jgi:hypothetical protein
MININTPQTISGKIRTRTPTQAEALSSRYTFLNLNNAEPNLGIPKSPGIKQEYLGDDGYRYLLLSNNTSSLSAWRVWSYDNPRIAAYSKENSIALGDNANPINNNSIVYNNHPYGTNVYNSQSFVDNSFNVFSLSGIYLFDATTIGDPASATAFVVTDDGKVGINTNSPEEALSIVGNVSATGNLIINTNATLGKGKTSTNILRGTVKIADSSPSSVVFGVSDVNYDTNLYRGGANILKTDDLFVCDSLSAINTLSAGNISVNNIRAAGNVTIFGNLTALGTSTFANTIFTTTSALSVINSGRGPALYIAQSAGNNDIAQFYDLDGIEVLHIGNAPSTGQKGSIGVNESFPSANLTVNGTISSNNVITVLGGDSKQWNSNWTTTNSNSGNWSSAYTTLNSISSIIPDPATTISAQIGVGPTALNSINFLNTSSAQLLYTVPAGKVFLVADFSIIIDSVAGGSVSDPILPTFRLYRHDTLTNATNQVTNTLTPTSASGSTIAANRYYRLGGSVAGLNGKALVSGSDASPQNKLWFRVESLGTNTYTGLSGRVIVTGNLI